MDTEVLRQRLVQEAAELSDRLGRNGGFGLDRPMNDSVGELSGYDNHPADLGSEMFERGKDIALREAGYRRLDQVQRALDKIEGGNYGMCERCGRPIAEARLEADPAAGLCIACQTREDQREGDDNRPVEEAFLAPGFGRTFMDGRDQTGYDGEDAWQDVALYGTSSDVVRTFSPQSDDDDDEG